jgi:acetoin utilization deacetylase AcuC-like enzyme
MTATGVEQAAAASYAQTEMFFIQHCDYLLPRVHQMRTDLAQYYHATKPSARLTYMTSADEKVNFEINGTDMLARDLNIFASTTANHRAILEQLKQMALTNNTTGASIYDLGKLVQSDSIAELNSVLKDAEQKQNAQKQQEQQAQQQMQEQQLAAQKEQKQMEIDAQNMRDEKNRQRDILVAEIRAAGYGSMTDVNKNQESDYVDAMREIRESDQYQQQTSLQREKEVNRMNNDAQKNQIEREKIAAQKEIANKQLQIAQENKNKFDVKSKNKDEKK